MTSTVERNRTLRALAIEFAQTYPFLAELEEAAGRCFWAAMTFASFAASQGYPVEVIRWHLAEDLLFDDHWAVVMHGNHIIDHTRAQVDGVSALFWQVTQYPKNYLAPRRYPASLILADFNRQPMRQDGQFSPDFMAMVKDRLAKFDADHYQPPPIPIHGWGLLALAASFFAWRLFA